MVCQSGDFVRGVADVEQRNVQFCMQAPQIRQDVGLALRVQRGQRLIQQQQARVGQQCAGNANALALPAGQAGGAALQQMANPQ